MIDVIFNLEEKFGAPLWIERVPSQSNPADVLSRETVAEFKGATGARVSPGEMWSSFTK